MGWKMVYLARRNPGLAAAEFPQAWREHSALGARCTNVRDKVLSVTQCSRVLEPPPLRGAADDYDGVNLLALRDLQAAADIWSDPETLTIMRPDEPRVFATYVRDFTLVCEERPLRDNPRTTTALIGFLRRSTGRTGADWQRWMQSEAAAVLAGGVFATARRVVHDEVCRPPPPGYEYDSVLEWWFDSTAAARAAFGGRDVRDALVATQAGGADLQRSVFVFAQVTHSRP